jgi:hypothetical protein
VLSPPPLLPGYCIRRANTAAALPPPRCHWRCRVVATATIALLPPLLPPPGERGMMVVMGHCLCVSFDVSGEMTKNKDQPETVQGILELNSVTAMIAYVQPLLFELCSKCRDSINSFSF